MARRKSEKQLDIERRYERARESLKRSVRRYKQLSYTFSKDIVPKRPQRITEASIRAIKRVHASEEVEYKGYKGPEARKEWKKDHPTMGHIIYARLQKIINRLGNIPQAKRYASKVLDDAIADLGYNVVMRNLWETRPEVVERADLFLKNSQDWHEEITTHYWRELVRMGELPTEDEAQEEGEAEDFQYTDEASPFDPHDYQDED